MLARTLFSLFVTLNVSVPAANCAPACYDLFGGVSPETALKTSFSTLPNSEIAFFVRPAIGFTYFSDADFNFGKKWSDSFEHPTPLFGPDAGSYLFRGQVFIEGYFRVYLMGKSPANPDTPQAWLRWSPTEAKYVLEHGNLNRELLGPYVKNARIKLFRGLNEEQLERIRRLRSGDGQVGEIFTADHPEMFFTPDEEVAKKWAKSHYIEMSFSEKLISQFYSGIEFDYVEAALRDPKIFVDALPSLVEHSLEVQP